MKIIPLYTSLLFCLLVSCAKLPVESVQLAETIAKEGERMHKINVALLGNLLDNKKEAIRTHVKVFQERQIQLIFEKTAAAEVNMNEPENLTGFFNELKSYVNNYEDSLMQTLEKGYRQYVEILYSEYLLYQEGCTSLKNLLSSSVKVNKARQDMLQQILKLSGSKANIQKIEESMDNFIHGSGSVAEKSAVYLNAINGLLNK